jgi:hypothetical protein
MKKLDKKITKVLKKLTFDFFENKKKCLGRNIPKKSAKEN